MLQGLMEKVNELYGILNTKVALYNSGINRLKKDTEITEQLKEELVLGKSEVEKEREKYADIESFETARENSELTVKAAEKTMKEITAERRDFEQYKEKELEAIKALQKKVCYKERELENKEKAVNQRVDDFNVWRERYVDYKIGAGGLL